MKRRAGEEFQRDFTDEICRLGQRLGMVYRPGLPGMEMSPSDADPFDYAHSSLVRCREQASTENPCGPGVLIRVRSSVGQFTSDAEPYASSRYPTGQFGSDIHDAVWMSWL